VKFVLAFITLVVVPTATASYKGITQTRFANAWCESTGDIHAIGWHGLYRGKWQFDQSTWNRFAPWEWRGRDPAWAPEWVQDRAALAVTYDAWPNC
jgi:hypothetical protein